MNPFYPFFKNISLALLLLMAGTKSNGQTCTPQGDTSVYGTGDVWKAYVFQGINFNTYKGYVNKGVTNNPNIDESFGGSQTNFATNGCPVYTDTFSVRFKLTKTFADSNYIITVGADDGYRLSLDGGATWVINNWNEHSYASTSITVHLNGTVNMVLDFYERFGDNRITFNMYSLCGGSGDQTAYGGEKTWIGHIYEGTGFNQYKGKITRGSSTSMNFDESFGGANVTFPTDQCSITTQNFSIHFRSRTTFTTGSYTFTVGADDGYRLSLDGGATWVINNWSGHSYTTSSYTANLNGTYNVVLDYYEGSGDNRVSFSYVKHAVLPVTLTAWSARLAGNNDVSLIWKTQDAVNFDHFIVQKSYDAQHFTDVKTVTAKTGTQEQSYSYVDQKSNSSKVYYRLAMVDKDAAVRYSSIEAVSMQQESNIRVYPTVVENKQVYVECNKKIDRVFIEVVDMNGRVLQSAQQSLSSGKQIISLQTAKSSGSYIVRVSSDAGLLVKQAIIVL